MKFLEDTWNIYKPLAYKHEANSADADFPNFPPCIIVRKFFVKSSNPRYLKKVEKIASNIYKRFA